MNGESGGWTIVPIPWHASQVSGRAIIVACSGTGSGQLSWRRKRLRACERSVSDAATGGQDKKVCDKVGTGYDGLTLEDRQHSRSRRRRLI